MSNQSWTTTELDEAADRLGLSFVRVNPSPGHNLGRGAAVLTWPGGQMTDERWVCVESKPTPEGPRAERWKPEVEGKLANHLIIAASLAAIQSRLHCRGCVDPMYTHASTCPKFVIPPGWTASRLAR